MRKRGFSITELLVVMGMTSVILTVGLRMVHRVMREQKAAERDNATHRVAQRLTTRLRRDVHYANRAKVLRSDDDSEQKLVLSQPEETVVTYVVVMNEILRTATQENKPTHRDSFRFSEECRLEFFDESNQFMTFTAFEIPQVYRAILDGESGAAIESDARRVVMHVEAAVGRDHRFLIENREAIEP